MGPSKRIEERVTEVGKIRIKNCIGISPVAEETKIFAYIAEEMRANRILDLGTGTGYIGIYLAKAGFIVDASDVDSEALDCAKENAKLNEVQLNCIQSDLFEAISGQYDLIIFNPPSWPAQRGMFKSVISVLRRNRVARVILPPIAHVIFGRGRVDFLERFLSSARGHLLQDGKILVHMVNSELERLRERVPGMLIETKKSLNDRERIVSIGFE